MKFTIEGKTYDNGHISSVYTEKETTHTIVIPEPVWCDSGQITIDKEVYTLESNRYNNGYTELKVVERRERVWVVNIVEEKKRYI